MLGSSDQDVVSAVVLLPASKHGKGITQGETECANSDLVLFLQSRLEGVPKRASVQDKTRL